MRRSAPNGAPLGAGVRIRGQRFRRILQDGVLLRVPLQIHGEIHRGG